jgi:hypothetical protein
MSSLAPQERGEGGQNASAFWPGEGHTNTDLKSAIQPSERLDPDGARQSPGRPFTFPRKLDILN